MHTSHASPSSPSSPSSLSSPRRSLVATLLLPLAFITGCASVDPVGSPGNQLAEGPLAPDQIRWPAAYEPRNATFFVTNAIDIKAPPEVVWAELIRAEEWPAWYSGASNVKVEGAANGTLGPGSSLSWRTMDLDFISNVIEFEPPYRLAWESRKSTIQGYHAWLLIRTDEGTRVVTEESQFGLLARLQGIFIPSKLRKLHDVWLDGLRTRSEAKSAAGSS